VADGFIYNIRLLFISVDKQQYSSRVEGLVRWLIYRNPHAEVSIVTIPVLPSRETCERKTEHSPRTTTVEWGNVTYRCGRQDDTVGYHNRYVAIYQLLC